MPEFKRHGHITQAEVYYEDKSLVGLAKEFKIPKIEWGTVDHETLGQVAVYKAPARPLQALEGSMTMSFIEPQMAELAYNPTIIHSFQLHSKVDIWGADGLDQANSYTLVTSLGLQFLSAEQGPGKLGDEVEHELEFSCPRLTQRVHDSDKVLLAVDVFAGIVDTGSGPIWPR